MKKMHWGKKGGKGGGGHTPRCYSTRGIRQWWRQGLGKGETAHEPREERGPIAVSAQQGLRDRGGKGGDYRQPGRGPGGGKIPGRAREKGR